MVRGKLPPAMTLTPPPGERTRPDPLRPHPLITDYYDDESQRRQQVDAWFDASAPHYNWITLAMSLGSGHWYRKQALLRAGLGEGMHLLDVACGTGVVAELAREIVGAQGLAIGLDASMGMLREARKRGVRGLVRALAEAVPFAAARFDMLSMGYALRHVVDLRQTFSEYHRVLKPGGKLLILEITPPRSRLSFHVIKFYLSRVVPLLARIGGGGTDSQRLMQYYWDTIEQCVKPPIILQALEEAGFKKVSRHVELGIFSQYTGVA